MGSKIFITGAAGFIGSQLAYYLLKKGHKVTLLDNFSYGNEDNLLFPDYDFRDEIIRGDVRNSKLINKLFEDNKFDYVYHIAAITPLPDCQAYPDKAVDVNITGTVIVLEASRVYGVKNVVFASTSAVYENNTVFPSKENHILRPNLTYPSTKYMSELFCQNYVENYGMNITCLRFANVYGPHLDCLRKQPPVVGYIIRELFFDRQPVLYGTGEQQRDFIYVDDLVQLCELVLKSKGFDIVNVSSGKPHSINEIVKIIAKKMKKEKIYPKYIDVSQFWDKYEELYKGYFPILKRSVSHEVKKYTELSNEYAYEKYGWKPKTSIEDGIKKTIVFTCEVLKRLTKEE